jgi:CBS domain-containing protein
MGIASLSTPRAIAVPCGAAHLFFELAETQEEKSMQVRDLMTTQELRVSDVMSSDVVTCRPDCPVEDAVNTMRERQIRRLVVTEEHRKNTVGVVSLGDIATRGHQHQLVGAATEQICQPA